MTIKVAQVQTFFYKAANKNRNTFFARQPNLSFEVSRFARFFWKVLSLETEVKVEIIDKLITQ
jgi:hypothetical protein